MIQRVEEEESNALMGKLFETNARCIHGDLGPFLDLDNVAHTPLPCHATLNNRSLECL